MITFFILVVLYGLIFPYLGYKIVQRRIKKITRIRNLIIERRAINYATVRTYNAIDNIWNKKEILEVLSEIDIIKVYNNYHKLYNRNLIDHLADEMDENDFNKAIVYFK